MSQRFRDVTDQLTAAVTLADLANEIRVSHGLMRQARLATSASSYRSPPAGWEQAVATLARRRASQLLSLADEIDGTSRQTKSEPHE